MKKLSNNSGFALITALMITMISLIIIMGIMTSVIQGQRSMSSKRIYKNAIEASYGGAEVLAYEIMSILPSNMDPSNTNLNLLQGSMDQLVINFGAANLVLGNKECINAKLTKAPSFADWVTTGGCVSETNLDPQTSPDITFNLNGVDGNRFVVNSKIVDTSEGVPPVPGNFGNVGGVVTKGPGFGSNLSHYVYRIEIAAARSGNSAERGVVSVVYEY